MGVHKLWDLLTATALPVRVESLFGKVCCVDASFWISHCLASETNMRHGGDVIAVFFLRICYLLDKGIKPVFVFDGKSPFAKLKTILRRKLISQKSSTNHKLLAYKFLANQMKNKYKSKINQQESENAVQPITETESLFDEESTSVIPKEVNLLDLFPEEFLNKTEDELEEHIQTLRECDFLNNKAKYDLINQVKDNIMQKGRETSLKLKDNMDDYSNHQIKSYIRDSKINAEMEKIKAEINSRYHPDHNRYIQFRLPSSSGEKIYDYNEEFAPRYLTNFSEYRDKIDENIPLKKETKTTLKVKTNTDYFDHYDDNSKYIIDDSVFATDNELFGDDLMCGFSENKQGNVYDIKDNQVKTDESKEDNFYDDVIENENEMVNDDSNNNNHNSTNYNKETQSSSNDYFLEMYKKYLFSLSKKDHSDYKYQNIQEYEDIDYDDSYIIVRHPRENSDDVFNDNSDGGYFESPNAHKYDRDNGDYDEENEFGSDNEDSRRLTSAEITEKTEAQSVVMRERHQYYEEIQSLLDCFGVPHIIAPGEAESQCAHMNIRGDCHAVISDDSDSLVFGAKSLLKNFYNDKVFELYTSERIEKELGIGRKQLALIAVICGCDYTNGVRGIGIVNALEVIKAYPNFEDLYEFKEWATNDTSIESATTDENSIREEYKKAHINYRIHWTFSPDFPNREAYNMFLNPKTTDDYELRWSEVDREGLEEFMSQKSAMPIGQVKDCLNMLFTKKSQQFIMEDIMPEISSKPVLKMAVKNYRKSLNINLSAFRNVLASIKSKKNYIFRKNKALERNHTLSKIRSKRMVDSIKTIKRRFSKSK